MSIRKVLTGAFIAGLLQLVLIGSASADLTKGGYVGLEGGMAWTANLTYTTGYGGCYPPYYCSYPSYYNAVTYDLGYSAGAMAGYSFGGPRVEFEYNYRNNGANTIATQGGTQAANGDLTANSYMVNVLYDFDTGSKWTPYIGLGLGMAAIKADNIHSANTSIDGSYINDAQATHEQLALDIEHQWMYWVDTYHKLDPDRNHRFRLMRYDITKHNMISLGWITLPDFGDWLKFPFYKEPYDSTMLVYDSINKVVLWPASSNAGRPILMIYHPDLAGGKNGSWEVDPMNRDKPNEIIFGSNGTFIPELNVMIIYGGFGTPHDDDLTAYHVDAPENYFWLYRYGNGK